MKTDAKGNRSWRTRARPGRAFAGTLLLVVALSGCATPSAWNRPAADVAGRVAPIPSGTGKGATRLLAPSSEKPSSLPSERNIPLLAALGNACDSLPAKTNLMPTRRGGCSIRLAVHQYNPGDEGSILVFVHGVLSDSTAFRYVAGSLGREHELWLIDLPGCGDSERPHPGKIEPDGYSPAAMAERVLQVIEACLAESETNCATRRDLWLVGHSLGGTTVLRMLSDPEVRARHPRLLTRVQGLVLLAPCDVELPGAAPVFLDFLGLQGWQVGVGKALGIVQQRAARAAVAAYQTPDRAKSEDQQAFLRQVTDPGLRRTAQAMMRQAVPWHQATRRPDWPAMRRITSQYTNIDVPCLIVWGQWDEILPASMGHKLKDEIPDARLCKLPQCGHLIPSEQPEETARLIRDFMASTGSGAKAATAGAIRPAANPKVFLAHE